MKKTPILSDEQILNLWDTHVGEPCSTMPLVDSDKEAFARAIEQAVLQSPQVQQWRKDAELWQALIGCARIRPLGSAGLKQPEKDGNYAHLGLELWTKFGRDYSAGLLAALDSENEIGREWLTKFSEIAARANTETTT